MQLHLSQWRTDATLKLPTDLDMSHKQLKTTSSSEAGAGAVGYNIHRALRLQTSPYATAERASNCQALDISRLHMYR